MAKKRERAHPIHESAHKTIRRKKIDDWFGLFLKQHYWKRGKSDISGAEMNGKRRKSFKKSETEEFKNTSISKFCFGGE